LCEKHTLRTRKILRIAHIRRKYFER